MDTLSGVPVNEDSPQAGGNQSNKDLTEYPTRNPSAVIQGSFEEVGGQYPKEQENMENPNNRQDEGNPITEIKRKADCLDEGDSISDKKRKAENQDEETTISEMKRKADCLDEGDSTPDKKIKADSQDEVNPVSEMKRKADCLDEDKSTPDKKRKIDGTSPCKFYHIDLKCSRGKKCFFSHDPLTEERRKLLEEGAQISAYTKKHIYTLHLGGRCEKGEGCFIEHKKFPCRRFHTDDLQCDLGDNCPFSHEPLNETYQDILSYGTEPPVEEDPAYMKKAIDIKDPPLCKSYFNNRKCFYKADCLYLHKRYPCKSFHTKGGECEKGEKCKFSHKQPLNESSEKMLQKVVDGNIDVRYVGNIIIKYRIHLNGGCKEGDNCKEIVHKTFPCKYFHLLKCNKSEECQYSHEPLTEYGIKLLEQCMEPSTPVINRFYKIHLTTMCTKGDTCPYAQKRLPCQSYHVAGKCFEGEYNCIYSHEPLSEEDRRVLSKTTPIPENFKKRIYSLHWKGKCDRGDGCYIIHKKFPCKYYHIDEPCNLGDTCPFSHEPLTNRTREILLYGIETPRTFNKKLSVYHMNGLCTKGDGCYLIHKKFPCKAFLVDSNCPHGDACEFSHKTLASRSLEILKNWGQQNPADEDITPGKKIDVNEPPLCESFFKTNECQYNDDCLFIHKKYPCKSFHTTGECEEGEKCKYTHEPLNEETQAVLQQIVDDNLPVSPSGNVKGRYRSHLNGGCKRGKDCKEIIHKKFPCKYFHLYTQCSRGENCQFSHDPLTEMSLKLLELCVETTIPVKNRFYKLHLTMKCPKGETCQYAQEKLPCRFLHIIGKCFYNDDDCAFSHEPLNDETQQILEKEFGLPVDKIKVYLLHFNGECETDCDQLVHKTFPCKSFHMDAKCKKGDSCIFSHEPLDDESRKILKLVEDLAMPEAERRFYRIHLNGKCNKGLGCRLVHKKFPCLNFHIGYICIQGEYCEYSHGLFSDEHRKIMDQVLDSTTKIRLFQSVARRLKKKAESKKDPQNSEATGETGSTAINESGKEGEQVKKKRRRNRYRGERRELPYLDYGPDESSYYGSQPRQIKMAVRRNRFPSLMAYDQPPPSSSYAMRSRPSFMEPPMRPRRPPYSRSPYMEFPERRYRSSFREPPMRPQRSSYMESSVQMANRKSKGGNSEFWKSLQKWVTLLPNVLENQTTGAESVTGLKQLLGQVNQKLGITGQDRPAQEKTNTGNQPLKRKGGGELRTCWFFLKGRCTRGDTCSLAHTIPSAVVKKPVQKTKLNQSNLNNSKRVKNSHQPWQGNSQSAGHQKLGFAGLSRTTVGPSLLATPESQHHPSHDMTPRQGFGQQSHASFGLPAHAPSRPDTRPQPRPEPRPPPHPNLGMAPRPGFEQQSHHIADNSQYPMREHQRETPFFNMEMQQSRRAEPLPGRNEDFFNSSGPAEKQFADSSFNEYMRPQTQYMNEQQQYLDTGRRDGAYESEMYQHQGNHAPIHSNEAVGQFVEHQRNISSFPEAEQPRAYNTGTSWNAEYSGRNDQSFQAGPPNYSTNRKSQWSNWSSQYGNVGENRRGVQEKVSIPWMHFEQ